MGYNLAPNNADAGVFHLGAFAFPVLLETVGCLWPCISSGPRWYAVFGVDPRMPIGDKEPRLHTNDGFPVTDEEAKIMARCARNFVAIQRSLPVTPPGTEFPLFPGSEPWPRKIRGDWVDTFEKFAAWAEISAGFSIN